MSDEWIQLITLVMAVLVMLAGFAKWFISWAEKRDCEQEIHFNQRIKEHDKDFDKVHDRIDKHVDELNKTREQMHREFVKHTDLQDMRKEIREDINNLFVKISGISKALNQLIGVVSGKVKDD